MTVAPGGSGLDPAALAGALAGAQSWLVGGAVRDELLGRATDDLDVVTAGDPAAAAARLRAATGAAAFGLGAGFGGWRVVGRKRAWQVDILPLQGEGIEDDLARRDFTLNAIARPLDGGALVDPFGGRDDLFARILRVVGPESIAEDPVRAIRAVRIASDLDLAIVPRSLAYVRAGAALLATVAAERVFAELRRILTGRDPVAAMRLAGRAGIVAGALPELASGNRLAQALELLAVQLELEADPRPSLGERGAELARAALDPMLAEELTGWGALRLAALLDPLAAPLRRAALQRLRVARRLGDAVRTVTEQRALAVTVGEGVPLDLRATHRYLVGTAPDATATTVLAVAARLARAPGPGGATAAPDDVSRIADWLPVAHELLERAARPATGAPLRGDELARELEIAPGPELGDLLAQLAEDHYAGAIETRADALKRAAELLARGL